MSSSSLALFFCFNLLFCSLAIAQGPVVVSPASQSPSTNEPRCPLLNLRACVNVIGLKANVLSSERVTAPCCTLLEGLTDLEASACVCLSALNAKALGLVRVDVSLRFNVGAVLNKCGQNALGSQCPGL